MCQVYKYLLHFLSLFFFLGADERDIIAAWSEPTRLLFFLQTAGRRDEAAKSRGGDLTLYTTRILILSLERRRRGSRPPPLVSLCARGVIKRYVEYKRRDQLSILDVPVNMRVQRSINDRPTAEIYISSSKSPQHILRLCLYIIV